MVGPLPATGRGGTGGCGREWWWGWVGVGGADQAGGADVKSMIPWIMLATPALAAAQGDPATLSVQTDNVPLRTSATIEPGAQPVIDVDGDGVIHVLADGVVLDFARGAILRGAAAQTAGDKLAGVGIRVDGHKDVTIRNVRLTGFKVGIWATRADGLTIENADVQDIYRMRLASTPIAESGEDWLWPHRNDQGQWRDVYGGAIVVENSSGVTIRACTVRRSQNGIILDRVTGAKVYDNDCSFLSGWGLAMWRSSDNTITRNALDFCVRGYSHNVYNRGQDSAGILLFEQCSRNIIAENSATHGGDGLFGFAGHDALGETFMNAERERLRAQTGRKDVDDLIEIPEEMIAARKRAGCNDNIIVGNDFSFAAAHGLEMTFSFGNKVVGNRFVGNAICGVWGGYSADTLISGNYFESNGGAGYGEERGGVNIEHGRDNTIVRNTFVKNAAGVHLWARANPAFARMPWGLANAETSGGDTGGVPSARSLIAGNTFEGDRVALRVRNSAGSVFAQNTTTDVAREIDADEGSPVDTTARAVVDVPAPKFEVYGTTRPVGRAPELDGRAAIVMAEWGPWEHESVYFRERQRGPRADMFEVFGVSGDVAAERIGGATGEHAPRVAVIQRKPDAPTRVPAQVMIAPPTDTPGIWPYTVRVTGKGLEHTITGILVSAPWTVRIWNWTANPMTDIEAWRAEATAPGAVAAEFDALNLPFGYRSPSAMNIAPVVSEAAIKPTKFAIIARTMLPLSAGSWIIRTRSDDGLRVTADGRVVIERWNTHGPTNDEATLTLDVEREVPITVEYFQNDGYATLTLEIQPAPAPPGTRQSPGDVPLADTP